MQKSRLHLPTGAILGILLLTVGTFATAAETYHTQTKTVKTVTTRTSSDEERATEREATALQGEVASRLPIFQQQLASVTDNSSFGITPVTNRARTAWSNWPKINKKQAASMNGTPVQPQDNTFIWESPSIRGPAATVTHSNGYTIITPRH